MSFTLGDIDNDTIYLFQARATDSLGTVGSYYQAKVGVGQPIMMVDEITGGVGINCIPSGRGIYPRGDALDANNPITETNPARLKDGGIQIHEVYNAGGPAQYGNLINIGGLGQSQLFLG